MRITCWAPTPTRVSGDLEWGQGTHTSNKSQERLLLLVWRPYFENHWSSGIKTLEDERMIWKNAPYPTYEHLKSTREKLYYLNNLLKILNDGLCSLASVGGVFTYTYQTFAATSIIFSPSCSSLTYSLFTTYLSPLYFTKIHLSMEPNFLDTLSLGIFFHWLGLLLRSLYRNKETIQQRSCLQGPTLDCFTLVICVVVVVDTDSDVMVCAVSNVPESPPAPPSIFRWLEEKYKVMLNFHYVVREDPSPSNMHLVKSSKSAEDVICLSFACL